MEEIFKKEEEMLNNYPKEWLKNYYQNKETLKIKFKDNILESSSICGQYIAEDNTIEVLVKEVLYHELSHMAFCDKTKYNKQIKDNMYYENGVAVMFFENNEKKLAFKAINEGFAEYLARKNTNFEGQHINYYFANMLIKIFGEDLLKYPLTNDPVGFTLDDRFCYMQNFLSSLDKVNKYYFAISVADEVKERIKKIKINKKLMKKINLYYNYYIIQTFELIYKEFKNYSDRLINYEEFLILLNDFNNYDLFNSFDSKKYNVKKYINSFK